MDERDNDADDYDDFPTIGFCAKVDVVRQRINDRYDELYFETKSGIRMPYVCSFCDELLTHPKDVHWMPIHKLILPKYRECIEWKTFFSNQNLRIAAVEQEYTYSDPDNLIKPEWKEALSGLAISPRGIIAPSSSHGNARLGFSCCQRCSNHLNITSPTTPFYAIVNNNFVGCAPSVLTDLTEVELALVQPVLKHGYCFTYSGGRQTNMKGVMSFFRVEERKIASGLVQVEQMGLNQNVVVLLTGKMTLEQRKRATEKANGIRTDKCIAALEWLCEYHPKWKNINLEEIRSEFEGRMPVVIDNSSEIDSENANVESEEQFICYVPDASLNDQFGGFEDPEAFKMYVDKMHEMNFQVTLHMPMGREFLGDSKEDDFLVATCLLVFPYGRCGMFDDRQLKDGSLTSDSQHEGFMRHLSLVSNPLCQQQMFQLLLYSQISKWRLLKHSRLQVKGEQSIDAIANSLNPKDLSDAVQARRDGNRFGGTFASNTFLRKVNATAASLPHTGEAAKKARQQLEALQHKYGVATIFLTVNFDDENSLLLQILTREEIDDDREVDDLTDDECAARSERRREIRIKYPGMAATNYMMLLNILVEEVIGWDMRENRSTEKEGLFGICEAFCLALEEQGRKSLHGHMTIWIRRIRELRKRMFFARLEAERTKAKNEIIEYYDRLVTTELFNLANSTERHQFVKSLDHECTVLACHDRQLPVVVDKQNLRHFRHIQGFKHENGVFAFCPHCPKKWSYEELIFYYLTNYSGLKDLVSIPQHDVPDLIEEEDQERKKDPPIPVARMQAKIIEYQSLPDCDLDATPSLVINAFYNAHKSRHVKNTCFKCLKQPKHIRKKHKHCGECECRMRLPDLPRPYSEIVTLLDANDWYSFTGVPTKQSVIELLPKRGRFDLFQNVSVKAITESKMSCNTNMSFVTDGPISQYQIKYETKNTQKDDAAEYSALSASIKKMGENRKYPEPDPDSEDPDNDRKEADKKETMRRIIRGAFAHNSQNVIGAPMAALLVQRKSRFYLSHEFVPCPLKDLIKLGNNETVTTTATYHLTGEGTYWENQALHYLCRHERLEHLSPFQLYSKYEVCFCKMPKPGKRRHDGTFAFFDDALEREKKYRFQVDTGFFKHPSALKLKDEIKFCPRGLKLREDLEEPLIMISQWSFPDTKKFKADIMTCAETNINDKMETYASLVLHLFCHYRHSDELKAPNCRFPFVKRLRQIWNRDLRCGEDAKEIFTEETKTYLQNIQNCAYNSLRYKLNEDALQRETKPFAVCSESNCEDNFEEDEDEVEELPEDNYQHLMEQFGPEEVDTFDEDPQCLPTKMQNFSFKFQRHKGKDHCGYNDTLNKATSFVEEGEIIPEDFVSHSPHASVAGATSFSVNEERIPTHSKKQLVTVYLTRTTSRAREKVFENNPNVEVLEANGSYASMKDWCKAAKLDKKQKRAFESLVSAFILTFYNDTDDTEQDDDDEISTADRAAFRDIKKILEELMGAHVEVRREKDQLICLIHGPGGSGKSTVVNLVIAYAKEYCELIGHPFTSRTIVVTAMSGVAATLLHGETTHSALGLNRKIKNEEIEEWEDTRLVIIDEISFAADQNFEKICTNLQKLKKNRYKLYGGLNIVFLGDYSQLVPIKQDPIYARNHICPEFHGALNCYIELDGRHRFRNDPEFGELCYRMREGKPTQEDIATLNDKCLVKGEHLPPPNVQVATYYNKERDAINASVFNRYCKENGVGDAEYYKGAIVILMDNVYMKDVSKSMVPITSNRMMRYFWEEVGESDCDTIDISGPGRIDPLLKLYYRCPLMMTQNKSVSNGQANGSRVYLEHVEVKRGEVPFLMKLDTDVVIRAYLASQVKRLVVKHENSDIQPRMFSVEAEKVKFFGKLKIGQERTRVKMSGKQFGLISNACTTGHKLQGYTALELFVNEWAYHSNWPYVVVSRVTTMLGLFFRIALSTDLSKYAMPEAMTKMLSTFRERISVKDIEDDRYELFLRREMDRIARFEARRVMQQR